MSDLPVLEGDGVLLRPLVRADGPELVTAVRASWAQLSPWMPWASPDYAEPDAEEFLRLVENGTERAFGILEPGDPRLKGVCAINRVDQANRTGNLGFWLLTDATGRGLATRAADRLLRFSLADLALERVEVLVAVDNSRSLAVAKRLDLVDEGLRGQAIRAGDRQHDARVFAAFPQRHGPSPYPSSGVR